LTKLDNLIYYLLTILLTTKQRNKEMNKTLIGVAVFLGVFVLLPAFVGISSYISYANYGNSTENLIEATYTNNKNILAQYGQKIAEIAQVPAMYRDDLNKVTTDAIQGRYGKDGSKAVFHMLKEQNPTLDSGMYRQIQQAIEAGRNEFQAAQTKEIDIIRQYKTVLGNVWSGLWLKIANYPKIDLTKFQPVSTDRANDAFSTGVEAPIKLR
jgi:uncharacterized protein (UPF0333 family)